MAVFHFEYAYDAPVPKDIEKSLQRVAECCLDAEGIDLPCTAFLRFTDDAAIHQINLEYRQVDKSTDVLSFPSSSFDPRHTAGSEPKLLRREWDSEAKACVLGDIIISVEHAERQAEEYGHSVTRELCYLTAHSLFHLMGYDHMQEDDRKAMRQMEEKALNAAGVSRVDDETLISKAKEAMEFSYSPYSHFKVGACLLSSDGRIFTGCNIENASYGAANCAERTAVFKAVSEGVREFAAIAIAADKALPWPCGICRQVLSEFAPNIRVIVVCGDQKEEARLSEILPHQFGPSSGTGDFLGEE